jgi:hypothetical protein
LELDVHLPLPSPPVIIRETCPRAGGERMIQ